ncbi:hypothetical protein I2485_09360 [Nesterenkonia sp. E16_7]|uniref:hypothetical protein n=1 Tax=unclassified Nesterenkonia TaxID=2629769 RepID=UPI001A93A1D3|nr:MULTISPECIES: hypothetical protein [unclassified Nesterenkonia]MBO0594436.1 hypothetical protein [Nesterenkonia sp. E16_10]MBO0598854.1 hypothetical protein [Nesterenkonia sp. E16_7]
MSPRTRNDGTAVWWFVAAAFAFSSTSLFASEMPLGLRIAMMVLGAVLLVGGIITYRKERRPEPPRG